MKFLSDLRERLELAFKQVIINDTEKEGRILKSECLPDERYTYEVGGRLLHYRKPTDADEESLKITARWHHAW